jgi:hypothetical protein
VKIGARFIPSKHEKIIEGVSTVAGKATPALGLEQISKTL